MNKLAKKESEVSPRKKGSMGSGKPDKIVGRAKKKQRREGDYKIRLNEKKGTQ